MALGKREKFSLKYRRSIYVSKKINREKKITKNNIKIVRPSLGLNIKFYNKILFNESNEEFKSS